jgi:hypothetical protein
MHHNEGLRWIAVCAGVTDHNGLRHSPQIRNFLFRHAGGGQYPVGLILNSP